MININFHGKFFILKKRVRLLVKYYKLLQPYAKEFGVKIALENMFGIDKIRGNIVPDVFSNPTEYAEFYDNLNDADNFICLVDTGHAGVSGEDIGDTLRTLGKRVKALHIHDNKFVEDDHLIPFEGTLD